MLSVVNEKNNKRKFIALTYCVVETDDVESALKFATKEEAEKFMIEKIRGFWKLEPIQVQFCSYVNYL